eukprot:Lithocolla_globosa_v1_NODE_5651_length_1205_cov_28.533043.p1 type:complete len:141 gc:universal NODE_5651_length_1205_cov_28.533043:777-1199(+)
MATISGPWTHNDELRQLYSASPKTRPGKMATKHELLHKMSQLLNTYHLNNKSDCSTEDFQQWLTSILTTINTTSLPQRPALNPNSPQIKTAKKHIQNKLMTLLQDKANNLWFFACISIYLQLFYSIFYIAKLMYSLPLQN